MFIVVHNICTHQNSVKPIQLDLYYVFVDIFVQLSQM